MSEEEAVSDPTCQVCGRRLLPGERPTTYVTRDRAEAIVCELCKPRAEAGGWLRPEQAGVGAEVTRERRRPRGQMLGGLLSRRPSRVAVDPAAEAEAPTRSGDDEARGPSEDERRPPRPAVPRAPVAGTPRDEPAGRGPGTTVPEALRAFNASDHRRTVAGLSRTLGPPRASGLAIRASDGYPGARLTVAWELTWYQWEVAAGSRGPEVRESGKGETIEQLRAADRTWNLLVDADGTLEQRSASAAKETPGGAEPAS